MLSVKIENLDLFMMAAYCYVNPVHAISTRSIKLSHSIRWLLTVKDNLVHTIATKSAFMNAKQRVSY